MNLLVRKLMLAASLLAGCGGSGLEVLADGQRAEGPLNFQEVWGVLRSNLTDLTETELNQAAVAGLLSQLGGRVSLSTNGTLPEVLADSRSSILKSTIYDGVFGYIRLATVKADTAQELVAECAKLRVAKKLSGLVLDLRFCGGQDYQAAAAVADSFVSTEQVLLKWGANSAKATAKENAITLPLVVLANRETSGASEALAAVLRHAATALLVGGRTAGRANVFEEILLTSGQRLRVARSAVQLGNGEALTSKGLTPDIEVAIRAEEDRAYYEDAFKIPPGFTQLSASNRVAMIAGTNTPPLAATNRAARRQLNEAELVRRHRDGTESSTDTPAVATAALEAGKPLINDPVLARALDFLKGLAVFKQGRRL